MYNRKTLIVIGGGAAGFFSAVTAARLNPDLRVIILEKSSKLLTKVRISGGGRCNVTHACFEPVELVKHYPRGTRELIGPFHTFSPRETIDWFSERGVELKTEADGRMFPVTDRSETIVNCLLSEAEQFHVEVCMQSAIIGIKPGQNSRHLLTLSDGSDLEADAVIIATGGFSKPGGFSFLSDTGHTILNPVPSLFTFNMPGSDIRKLMGISVDQARVRIKDSNLWTEGPMLITHWGMSGPVVLKLSSLAARKLSEVQYNFSVLVRWLVQFNEDDLRAEFQNLREHSASKKILSSNPFQLPKRLWEFLVKKAALDIEMEWAHLNKEAIRRLCKILLEDEYEVKGKTTFKEEFVTCGGVSLKEIDFKTMQSKIIPGLYFCGEVLDIDGLTGGFNFQAAWTTANIAGKSCAEKLASE